MSDWFKTTIGEQATLQRGIDITRATMRDGSVPVYSSGGINGYHDEAPVAGPGVVMGRKGTLGTVFFIEEDFWPHDTTLWVKDFHGNLPRFVYYFFKSIAPQLLALDVGSANPTLNRNHVHPIPIPWPSRPTQEYIANILGTLDDKIELNRRMNRTLEAMARAVFRSWFVNFDPVHAKAKCRAPVGMDPETAALFPDSSQDSPLGKIPMGWEVKPIAELADFVNGRNFTKDATGTGRLVIRIAELNRGIGNATVFNDVEALNENTAFPDDILFAWSGSLGVYRWHGDESLINQHIFKVIPNGFPKWFVYFNLLEALPEFRSIASGKATTMGHIKRAHLREVQFAVPDVKVIRAANATLAPLYALIHTNERQTTLLGLVRDVLLPGLLAGDPEITAEPSVRGHGGRDD